MLFVGIRNQKIVVCPFTCCLLIRLCIKMMCLLRVFDCISYSATISAKKKPIYLATITWIFSYTSGLVHELACTLVILKCRVLCDITWFQINYFCVNDEIKSIYLRVEMKNNTHERIFSPPQWHVLNVSSPPLEHVQKCLPPPFGMHLKIFASQTQKPCLKSIIFGHIPIDMESPLKSIWPASKS